MNIHFAAPWGNKIVTITILSGLILVGLTAGQALWLFNVSAKIPPWLPWLLLLSPPAVLLGCALFMIRGYTLDAGRLIVHRLFWENALDLGDLANVFHDPEAIKHSIKICGNDGLFAMCGLFRNKTLGRYRAFVTDPKRAVVLKLRTRTVVVTPNDPEKFIKEIHKTFPKLANKPERSRL